MARYSKAYGKKGHGTSKPNLQSNIQFETIFCENSNRPSAAKSAGTIGKWGITSFTSIRSSNFSVTGRLDDKGFGSKRMRGDIKMGRRDPFIFVHSPPPTPTSAPPRPKKFFKSRNANEPPATSSPTQSQQPARKYSKSSPSRLPVTAASKKAFPPPIEFEEEQTEAMNLSSTPSAPRRVMSPDPLSSASPPSAPASSKSPKSPPHSHNPPIVLRIFKGTAQLVTHVDESQPPVPIPAPVAATTPERKSRRRGHSIETAGNVSPKRLRERHKGVSYTEDDPESESEFDYEALSIPTTGSTRSRSRSTTSVTAPPAPPPAQPIADPVEVPMETQSEPEQDYEPISEPTHTSPAVPATETQEETQEDETVEDISKQVEISAKIEEGQNLIESTYVDFSAAEKKLLDVRTKTSTDAEREKLLAVLGDDSDEQIQQQSGDREHSQGKQESGETEWFSDSECSDTVTEQTNTISESEVASNSVKEAPVPQKTPKKRSIFKSRQGGGDSNPPGRKKRFGLYKHKWSGSDGPPGAATPTQTRPEEVMSVNTLEAEFEEAEALTRVTSYPEPDADSMDAEVGLVTSIKCTKKVKGFYTVVRNVKKAYQIQESGEFQEFNDDVEYILDALQDNNPIATRCLSAISLASKCMAPAFRMHVRAHGTVAKFFRALHDATKDQSLGMCTATVMFVLSQDQLNMDLDRDCLELMLNLLESDISHTSALDDCGLSDVQLHKTRQKVRQLCADIQAKGHAKHLNLDNITVGHLAMEALLSLTSRRAGEWFKEELRQLGGLEHIVQTINDCSKVIDFQVEWCPPMLDKLRKVDRCLRVLENVTLQNEENNMYLLTYREGVIVDTLIRLFKVCDSELTRYPVYSMADKESVGFVIKECLIAILKVLINLTHDFNNKSFGSAMMGGRQGVVEATLHILLQTPEHVPDEQKFDIIVLALILLINFVEHSDTNRRLLIEANAPSDPDALFEMTQPVSGVSALVRLFYQQEELARTEERKTDAILDGEQKPQASSQEEFYEETVAMLLQKAGRNMEHTLVAAYIALLLGYLVMDNKEFELFIRKHLPSGNFNVMLTVLQKFFNFMTLTSAAGSGSSRGIKATEMVIKYLSESDKMLQQT
uniref:WAPL domain-containing protein n=1 Tax=Cuerna arida TaxID=1464854 RepID=A0A1B6FS43_9HEMI